MGEREFNCIESVVVRLNLKFCSVARNNLNFAYYASTKSLYSSKCVVVLRKVRQKKNKILGY